MPGIYGMIKKQKWQQKHKEEEGLFKCICTVRRVTVEVPIYTYVAFVEVSAKWPGEELESKAGRQHNEYLVVGSK